MKNKPVEKMNKKEVERAMRAFGERLAKLLFASGLPDEQKQAWATLVPEMTFEQLDRFAGILQRHVDAVAWNEMADARKKLLAIKAKYDQKIKTGISA